MTRTPAAQSSRTPAAPEAAGRPPGVLALARGRGRPQNEHRVSLRPEVLPDSEGLAHLAPASPDHEPQHLPACCSFLSAAFSQQAVGGRNNYLTGKQRAPRTGARSSAAGLPRAAARGWTGRGSRRGRAASERRACADAGAARATWPASVAGFPGVFVEQSPLFSDQRKMSQCPNLKQPTKGILDLQALFLWSAHIWLFSTFCQF